MALKRAVSVPTPTVNSVNASDRRAKSESTTERVRDAPSEEEALALLMDASRAEKKKRIAAKGKNQTGLSWNPPRAWCRARREEYVMPPPRRLP